MEAPALVRTPSEYPPYPISRGRIFNHSQTSLCLFWNRRHAGRIDEQAKWSGRPECPDEAP